MEGIRVSSMISHEMHDKLEAIAKQELSNKNILIRQALAFFLENRSRLDKNKSRKGK